MSGLRPLSETVSKLASQAFSRKHVMLGRIVAHWQDIVGPDLSRKTQPVALRYSKPKSKNAEDAKAKKLKATASLDVSCSSADAMLLHYQKDLMLERINQIFGDSWITAIRFVPESVDRDSLKTSSPLSFSSTKPLTEEEKTRLTALLADIDDPLIRDRLQALGISILQNGRS